MNPKTIIENKKECLICNNKSNDYGLEILNKFICSKCVTNINNLDVNDEEYEVIKNKFKNLLINYI